MSELKVSIGGALAIAAVSTLGDFIWATWIPQHRVHFGLLHGTLLFLFIGLYLGVVARTAAAGAAGGALIGLLAAGSFYLLAPLVGYSVMFFVWGAVWIALGALNSRLQGRPTCLRDVLLRGTLGAALSGVAFYAISGIWAPFNPRGWDYAVHFASWTVAYLPGFLSLHLHASMSHES